MSSIKFDLSKIKHPDDVRTEYDRVKKAIDYYRSSKGITLESQQYSGVRNDVWEEIMKLSIDKRFNLLDHLKWVTEMKAILTLSKIQANASMAQYIHASPDIWNGKKETTAETLLAYMMLKKGSPSYNYEITRDVLKKKIDEIYKQKQVEERLPTKKIEEIKAIKNDNPIQSGNVKLTLEEKIKNDLKEEQDIFMDSGLRMSASEFVGLENKKRQITKYQQTIRDPKEILYEIQQAREEIAERTKMEYKMGLIEYGLINQNRTPIIGSDLEYDENLKEIKYKGRLFKTEDYVTNPLLTFNQVKQMATDRARKYKNLQDEELKKQYPFIEM